MTCGMLYVMRRERRGVLHLDKYSPPKENWFVRKEKRKREKEKRIREEKRKRKERRKTTERKDNQQFSD